ncbi:DNA primase small subunit PriS [Haloprofundus salinisoli]|uniref:DNA primase small subunit PriS n=1 Tax=Haloprofundus salinisoli TaxID=2876193 RepID=UPI001CCF6DA9|nr:DNA primase small subunit PriS [Haloprofundus salinisoli]
MNRRTREYLRGRFGDYYRSADLTLPPAADRREWGHIPWTAGGTTMVRHQSLLDVGDLGGFLARESPRHVYFSAARYADPGANEMDDKGWQGADLVFDLDADHLPGVDPDAAGYAEMLAECKEALLRLLTFLEDDFAFSELEIVFSGGRGYHVHVRDESVRELDSEARREIVDYVRAIDLDFNGLVATRSERGTTRRVLRNEGGWGKRTHEALLSFVEELEAMDDEDAGERLQEFDGIGEGRAKTILGALRRNPDAIRAGNVEAGGPGLRLLAETIAGRVVADQTAPIDEPVTTDVRRLIRLPGSLHGGSSLVVTRLDRDEVERFEPLRDAVPERFTRRDIAVELAEPATVEVGGETTKLSAGENTVTESVGVFLMTRGAAEKARE